jgi:hypothetical protein
MEAVVARVHNNWRWMASTVAVILALPAVSPRAEAQDRAKQPSVPRSAMPPAGMCRIWLKDVAASQQPASTDCAAAIRARPQDALVLFGGVRSDEVGPSSAAAPMQPFRLSNDPLTRQRELERRAMYDNVVKSAMQPKGVTATVVTDLPSKSTTPTPVVVKEPGSKTP